MDNEKAERLLLDHPRMTVRGAMALNEHESDLPEAVVHIASRGRTDWDAGDYTIMLDQLDSDTRTLPEFLRAHATGEPA